MYGRPYRGVNGARVREDDEGHGRTATAKFPGTCVVTGKVINPGDTIRFVNRRPVLVTARVSDTFETSGGTFYRNRNGRCEDAPCCGCCTI